MGCGASKSSVTVVPSSDAPVYDPLAEYDGSWLDKTMIKSATADKVFITLEGGDGGVPKVQVAIPNGGCDDASKYAFGKAGAGADARITVLLYERNAGAAQVVFTNPDGGSSTVSFSLPTLADGTVRHALDAIQLEGVVATVRYEAAETLIASALDMADLALKEHRLPLKNGMHATVAYRTKPENTSMLVWLPGRNDMFSHPHVVPMLDALGLDLYVIDHRRLGRSQLGVSRDEFRLTSHCDDFRAYLEDHDAGIGFGLSQKSYDKVVLYAHSTGGLEASLYMREGKHRAAISAIVYNSPFLDFGMGGMLEMLCDSMDELMPIVSFIAGKAKASVMDAPGTGSKRVSAFGARMYSQYKSVDLRCRNWINNKTTCGWLAAAAELHEEALRFEPHNVPMLVLYTDGDVILDGDEIASLAKGRLSTDVTPCFLPNRRHDLLLGYTAEDNQEVMEKIAAFLKEKM